MYTEILKKVYTFAEMLGLVIKEYTSDAYFKGDMDGLHIWTAAALDDEEELFNVLHMIGHTIQWSISPDLRMLGSQLWPNPDDELLRRLHHYEWQANCYGMGILHSVWEKKLDQWLYDMYKKDSYYLTHFYKTGEKVREITTVGLLHTWIGPLFPKNIPAIKPYASEKSREGLVINF
jgi:hypothetical protein